MDSFSKRNLTIKVELVGEGHRAATRKHTMVGKNILSGRANIRLRGKIPDRMGGLRIPKPPLGIKVSIDASGRSVRLRFLLKRHGIAFFKIKN